MSPERKAPQSYRELIELGFCSTIDAAQVIGLIQELRKMLNALRRSVSNNSQLGARNS
jgi:hypothetical protein